MSEKWRVSPVDDGSYFNDVNILREDGLAVLVAVQNGNMTAEDAMRNARLGAAAPDLYEALDELVALMEAVISGDYKPDSFTCQPARAILAKLGRG